MSGQMHALVSPIVIGKNNPLHKVQPAIRSVEQVLQPETHSLQVF